MRSLQGKALSWKDMEEGWKLKGLFSGPNSVHCASNDQDDVMEQTMWHMATSSFKGTCNSASAHAGRNHSNTNYQRILVTWWKPTCHDIMINNNQWSPMTSRGPFRVISDENTACKCRMLCAMVRWMNPAIRKTWLTWHAENTLVYQPGAHWIWYSSRLRIHCQPPNPLIHLIHHDSTMNFYKHFITNHNVVQQFWMPLPFFSTTSNDPKRKAIERIQRLESIQQPSAQMQAEQPKPDVYLSHYLYPR